MAAARLSSDNQTRTRRPQRSWEEVRRSERSERSERSREEVRTRIQISGQFVNVQYNHSLRFVRQHLR